MHELRYELSVLIASLALSYHCFSCPVLPLLLILYVSPWTLAFLLPSSFSLPCCSSFPDAKELFTQVYSDDAGNPVMPPYIRHVEYENSIFSN